VKASEDYLCPSEAFSPFIKEFIKIANMIVKLHKHKSPYTLYGLHDTVNLTSAWQTYTLPFTTKNFSSPVSDARLRFAFAANAANGDIYHIDDVMLTETAPFRASLI
jgi:hypothetical protein